MESHLLGGSTLSNTGGDNLVEITPGNDEFNDTFQSNQQDWGTSAWNED